MPAKIEISYKTILFTVALLLSLWFLLEIKEIIAWVFIAFILMSALKPTVEYLEKFRIPRQASIIFLYICLILLLVFIGSSMIPLLVTQSMHLMEKLPEYISFTFPFLNVDPQIIIQQVGPLGQNILKVSLGIFNNIIALFTIFVISFYLLLSRKHLSVHLLRFTEEKMVKRLVVVVEKVEERLGAWVRGQVALALTIGVFTFLGLVLLGIPYMLPLAILAGLLEIIPNIGPIISAVPAVLIAFTISPLLAVLTVIVYFVIQQVENHIIVPVVMSKVVGLPPLVTIIAILIGAKVAGVGGAILAVPLVVISETVITEYLKQQEE